MNNYYVYLHTNKVNGKVYIGITSLKPEQRWANGRGYKGQHFSNAIKKYGWDEFEHEVLYSGLSKAQAKVLEVSLIHFYKSTNPKYGYNVSEGGDIISEETKAKLSEAKKGANNPNYGKYLSDKIRKKMSEARKGANNHMYGKHHTEEAKAKISEAKKGNTGFKHPKSKSCICLTTSFAFGSTREAARFYNIDFRNIGRCCRGERKSAGKFNDKKLQWKYICDLPKPPMTEEDKEHLKDMLNKYYVKIQ